MAETNSNHQTPPILLVDDDIDLLKRTRLTLISNGLEPIETLDDSLQLLPRLGASEVSVLILDWIMPDLGGAELLPLVLQQYPSLPVIIMTALHEVQTAVECMRAGAFDFITKPVDPSRLVSSVRKALQINELSRYNQSLKDKLLQDMPLRQELFSGIITCSRKMEAIFRYIEALGHSNNPVLVTGESGVGKELLARAIHRASGCSGEFVAVNVAGLDDLMFADTLFGHRKGAFTGAGESRDGLLRKAENGTIFLDEIGDLSGESQLKLLRLLQEKEYYRLGSDAISKTSARVVTATNRNFKQMIEDGRFRLDLYHRLSGHEFNIPPLRERKEDLPLLLAEFAAKAAAKLGKEPPVVAAQLLESLNQYDFPGNVRELENRTFNAVTVNSTGTLTIADFPGIPRIVPHPAAKGFNASFERFPSLAQVEKLMIVEALKQSDGNRSAAADMLGISRMTLIRKLSEKC